MLKGVLSKIKINKEVARVLTIVFGGLSILFFEVFYCNAAWVRGIISGDSFSYIFSVCRLVIYVLMVIGAVVFVKKTNFWDKGTYFNNNVKKALIAFYLLLAIITLIVGLAAIPHFVLHIRKISVLMIAVLMFGIFLVNASNDVVKNTGLILMAFGLVFTIATDFNHAIDEKKHFMTAYNVSFLNFDYSDHPVTDKRIDKLPQLSDIDTIDGFLEESYIADVTNDVNMEDTPSTPAGYNIIFYIPSALGITFARVIGGSIIDIYILGRVFNLLMYVLLVCFAIKITPYKKNIFAVVAAIPFMLLLGATYSIDGYCIGLAYVFIAYCFKLKKEVKIIKLKQFMILSILFILLILAKNFAYVFVGLLIFTLPIKRTLKEYKKYWPVIAAVVGVMIVLAVIIFGTIVSKELNVVPDNRTSGNDAGAQLSYIFSHPVHDIKLAIFHIRDTLMNFNWFTGMFATTFFSKNSIFLMLPLMLFILYVAVTEDDYNFKIRAKILFVVCFMLVYGMTSVALYLSFTKVGALNVAGYQTRYIAPILPLLLFCLSSDKLKTVSNKNQNRNLNIALCESGFVVAGVAMMLVL